MDTLRDPLHVTPNTDTTAHRAPNFVSFNDAIQPKEPLHLITPVLSHVQSATPPLLRKAPRYLQLHEHHGVSFMKHVHWSDLHAFTLVARHRSYRQAAIERGVTAAALSRTISLLEHRLGVRLLNRTTRGVAPTEAGTELMQLLTAALERIEAAVDSLSEFRGACGQLRIHVACLGPQADFLAVVDRFTRAYPKISVEINADHTLCDLTAAGFDLGLRNSEDVPGNMIAVPFGRPDRFIVVAAPEYIARSELPRDPHDLTGQQMVRRRLANGQIQQWELSRAGERVSISPSGPITLTACRAELQAAVAGLGYAYVTELCARALLDAQLLAQVLDDWCLPTPALSLCYPSCRHVPAPVRTFVDFIRAQSVVQRADVGFRPYSDEVMGLGSTGHRGSTAAV